MIEIELKFLLDEAGETALRASLARAGLPGRARTATLRTVYFDTPDQALRRAGLALRLRRQGGAWVQTLKADRTGTPGLMRVTECDCPAPGGRLDLAAIPDAALRARVQAQINGHPLLPVVQTDMRRTTRLLALDGAQVELAIDHGEIRAGTRTLAHREAELELKSGAPAALFAAARRLFAEGGLRFSDLSKAERGFALLAGDPEPLAPRPARPVPLTAAQTVETAARDVLAECLGQIAHNIAVVLASPVPEGPHQLRIGLRRLRTAWAIFAPVLAGGPSERLAAQARWLGAEVGSLRDLDVARADILAPARAAHPDDPGFAALDAALAEQAQAARAQLCAHLRGPRAQGFLIDLAEMIAVRGWLDPGDYDQTAALARPLGALAPRALDRCWARATRRARGIADLGIEARHDLRKACKQLRYALEFLAPLAPSRRRAPFLKRLRAVQARFGALNDLAMVEAMVLGPTAPAMGDPAAQRAAGRILGAAEARAHGTWAAARGEWAALEAIKPFWR